jgi:hypothetical protein
MVALDVQGIGSFPITLDPANAPKAVAILQSFAAGSNAVEIHRAEPQPPAGSNGPPYALVQFTLPKSGLSKHQHEGSAKIRRGSVCLIGGADDIFVSLARNNEHDGWEVSMTIVGTMSDPALAEFEDKILALPKHDFVHPNYGTKMSMLNDKVPATLKLDDREL